VLPGEGHGVAWDLAWSPAGMRLAVGYADGSVRIFAGPGLALVLTLQAGAAINTLGWSGDGSILAVTAVSRPVMLWDARTGGLLRTVDLGWDTNAVAWTPDGRSLAAATDGRYLIVWDLAPPADPIGRLLCHWAPRACAGLGGRAGTTSYMGR
jgi:WD40 repeat protein